MPKTNNQVKNLLAEFKTANEKAKNYLSDLGKKIAELDLKYAQGLVKNDIAILRAAKTVLLNKKSK
ncbi:MAG: hypothetical protein HYV53_03415 [Parcubacteria group bacterium]|nr:hypothetical protein [Parcubacteria group bacterium]